MATYSLFQRKETGELMGRLETGLSDTQVFNELKIILDGHGLPALYHYAVQQEDSQQIWVAAAWWRLHTSGRRSRAAAVLAAWNAGTPRAAAVRQEKLTEWWPALGEALRELNEEQRNAKG